MDQDPRSFKSDVFSLSRQPVMGNASKETTETGFAEMSSDTLLDSVKEKLKSPFSEHASRPAASRAIVEKLSREERDKLAFMMVCVMIEPEQRKQAQLEQEEALAAVYLQLLLPEALEYAQDGSRAPAPPVSKTVSSRTSSENVIVDARAGVESPHIPVGQSPAVDSRVIASKTVQETPLPTSQSTPNARDRTHNEPVPDSEITIVSQHRSGSGHENAINFKQRDGGFDSIAAGTFDNGQSASGTQAFSVGQGLGLKAGDVASSITMATVAETGAPDEIAIRYRIKHAPQAPTNDADGATHATGLQQSAASPPPTYEQATSGRPPTYEQAIADAPPTYAQAIGDELPTYGQAIAGSPLRGAEPPAQKQSSPASAEKSARPRREVTKSNVAQLKPGLLRRLFHPAGLRFSGFVRYNAIESRAAANPMQLSAKKEPFALDAGTIQGSLSKGITRRELLKQFTQERGVPFPERSRVRGPMGHGH